MSNQDLGWSVWNEQFQAIDESLTISELHGLMMGIMCVTQAPNTEQWRQILALLKVPSLDDDAIQFLSEEAEDASHALMDAELDYAPILPDDEQPLYQRVQALADWCAGVVLGFGLAAQKLTDDEAEQIGILQDVASVEFVESDDDEDGEQAYEELYELVRLIPVALAIGRPNKLDVAESSLLSVKTSVKTADKSKPISEDVVEVYHPQRPS